MATEAEQAFCVVSNNSLYLRRAIQVHRGDRADQGSRRVDGGCIVCEKEMTVKKSIQASVFALAGLAAVSSFQVSADEELTIGVVSALEGPGSEWGRGVDGGTKIAAKEINDAGGLTVNGTTYQINVRSYNDGYAASAAVSAVTRLIEQDEVNFILGPLGSGSALAVKPMYEENGILALVNSYSPKTLENVRYTYRVLPTTAEYSGPIVGWIHENHPDIKSVAIISPNDQTGWDSQKFQEATYEKFGYDIVGTELFERSTKNFQPFVTRIMAQKPDLIELDTTPPGTAGLIIRQAREMGYQGRFSKIGGPGVPEIVDAAGKDFAEGTIVYVAADTNNPKYQELEEAYAEIYSPPMNAFNVFFYDAAHMLFQAIERAGTVEDTEKVRQELEAMAPYEGMQGTLNWGGEDTYGNNHQLQTPTFVGMIKDGKEVIVNRIGVQ
jgi:branched-chain amino acid transport system substrate-binding protein